MTIGISVGFTRHKDPVLGDGFYAFKDEVEAEMLAIPRGTNSNPPAVVRLTMPTSLYEQLLRSGQAQESPWSAYVPDLIQVVFKPSSFGTLNSPPVFISWKKVENNTWTAYMTTP